MNINPINISGIQNISGKVISSKGRTNRHSYNRPQEKDEFTYQFERAMRREERIRARRRKVLKQKIMLTIGALGISGGIIHGIVTSGPKDPSIQDIPTQNNPIAEDFSYPEDEFIFEDKYTETESSLEDEVNEILQNHIEVKEEYDKIIDALNRYSEELGEPALPLIKERIEKLGNNRVKPLDVLKILYLESRGRIYDPNDSSKILKSDSGAIGAFQITPRTAEFVNTYYALKGTDKELDVKNPYDNLDICILNLRFLKYQKGTELEEGKKLPTGDNLDLAVAWAYHDGAWAEGLSERGANYVDNFDTLSIIDDYPELVAYIESEDSEF